MECSVIRDMENPHWISLLRHVRQLNDVLRQLANHYLGNNIMASITDDEKLPKATSNVANACLEVTDATCVVMATMRAIIKRQKIESGDIKEDDAFNCKTMKLSFEGENSPVHVPNNDVSCALSHIELALSMSQKQRGGKAEHLLRHAVSMIQNAIQTNGDMNKSDDTEKGFKQKSAANAHARKATSNKKQK